MRAKLEKEGAAPEKLLGVLEALKVQSVHPLDSGVVATDCVSETSLEATQGQIDGFFSQLPYKCHQNRVASVGD